MPPKKKVEDEQQAPPLSAAVARRDHVSNTPFPHPDLFFKVYESEEDEPESKVRKDVLRLQVRKAFDHHLTLCKVTHRLFGLHCHYTALMHMHVHT